VLEYAGWRLKILGRIMGLSKLAYTHISVFILSFCAFAPLSNAEEAKQPIKVSGDSLSYLNGGKTIKAAGNVKVSYQDMTLTCQKAKVNLKENNAIAEGNVVMSDSKETITGDKVEYNFKTHSGKLIDSTFSAPPYYGAAPVIEQKDENTYIAKDGYITTCDPKYPHFMDYTLEAEEMDIYIDEKIVARKVRFKIGKLTLFYFPKYVHYLNDKRMKVKIVPGHKSDWGAFLLTAWDYTLNNRIDGKMHIDYREHRGWAFGPDLYYNLTGKGKGLLRTYYMHERDKRRPIELGGKKKQRYKIQWAHKWDISSTSYFIGEMHKFSDKDFLEDYYYNEDYEYDVSPDSYLMLSKGLPSGTLSIYAKKRTNKFYSGTEYLPRIRFIGREMPISNTNFYIKSNSVFANLNKKTANQNNGQSALRANTKIEFVAPFRVGILNLSPYVGTQQTLYSRAKETDESLIRGALLTGIDLNTKFYHIYDFRSEIFDIDRIRHIVEPHIKMEYISEPTVKNNKIEQFDNIDELARVSRLTFSIDNRFQTKHGGNSKDIMRLYLDSSYLFHSSSGSRLDEATVGFELFPNNYITLDSEFKYDWDKDDWKSARIDSWWHSNIFEIGIGHTYSRDESAQTILQTRFKGIKGITLSSYMRYEFETGEMQEQSYSIVKDLSCWELEISYETKKYESDTLWFILRIKALPDISIRATKSYDASPRTSGK